MAENNNTENSNIAKILQAIINGSSDYPDFKDNPPSRIALLLMLLGEDISDIKEIVENLPNPMVFKGTLGTGGDIESLPAPSEDNNGFTYIVITSGTYAQQPAKFGDLFTSTGTAWSYVPSGDDYVIDDSVTSTALTWSSEKINTALNSIVKSFEYVGNNNNDIVFTVPDNCHMILDYSALNPDNNRFLHLTTPIAKGVNGATVLQSTPTDTALTTRYYQNCAYSWNGNEITMSGTNLRNEYNRLNVTYTVHYI